MKKEFKRKIGQAILYITLYIGSVLFTYWAFLQGMTY